MPSSIFSPIFLLGLIIIIVDIIFSSVFVSAYFNVPTCPTDFAIYDELSITGNDDYGLYASAFMEHNNSEFMYIAQSSGNYLHQIRIRSSSSTEGNETYYNPYSPMSRVATLGLKRGTTTAGVVDRTSTYGYLGTTGNKNIAAKVYQIHLKSFTKVNELELQTSPILECNIRAAVIDYSNKYLFVGLTDTGTTGVIVKISIPSLVRLTNIQVRGLTTISYLYKSMVISRESIFAVACFSSTYSNVVKINIQTGKVEKQVRFISGESYPHRCRMVDDDSFFICNTDSSNGYVVMFNSSSTSTFKRFGRLSTTAYPYSAVIYNQSDMFGNGFIWSFHGHYKKSTASASSNIKLTKLELYPKFRVVSTISTPLVQTGVSNYLYTTVIDVEAGYAIFGLNGVKGANNKLYKVCLSEQACCPTTTTTTTATTTTTTTSTTTTTTSTTSTTPTTTSTSTSATTTTTETETSPSPTTTTTSTSSLVTPPPPTTVTSPSSAVTTIGTNTSSSNSPPQSSSSSSTTTETTTTTSPTETETSSSATDMSSYVTNKNDTTTITTATTSNETQQQNQTQDSVEPKEIQPQRRPAVAISAVQSTSAAISLISASPQGAVMLSRSNSILRQISCGGSDDNDENDDENSNSSTTKKKKKKVPRLPTDELPFASSPLQIRIYHNNDDLSILRGQLVGNALFLFLFLICHAIACYIYTNVYNRYHHHHHHQKTTTRNPEKNKNNKNNNLSQAKKINTSNNKKILKQQREKDHHQSEDDETNNNNNNNESEMMTFSRATVFLRFPGLVGVASCILIPETSSAVTSILIFSENSFIDIVCVVIGGFFSVVFPVLFFIVIGYKCHLKREKLSSSSLLSDTESQQEEGEQNQKTKKNKNKNKKKNNSENKNEVASSNNNSNNPLLVVVVFWKYLKEPYTDWNQNSDFVQKEGHIFDMALPGKFYSPWIGTVEILISLILGLMEGLTYGKFSHISSCLISTSVSLSVLTLYFVFLLVFRPHNTKFDAFISFSSVACCVVLGILVLTVLTTKKKDNNNGLEELMTAIQIVSVIVTVLSFLMLLQLLDTILIFHDALQKFTASSSSAADNGDDDDDDDANNVKKRNFNNFNLTEFSDSQQEDDDEDEEEMKSFTSSRNKNKSNKKKKNNNNYSYLDDEEEMLLQRNSNRNRRMELRKPTASSASPSSSSASPSSFRRDVSHRTKYEGGSDLADMFDNIPAVKNTTLEQRKQFSISDLNKFFQMQNTDKNDKHKKSHRSQSPSSSSSSKKREAHSEHLNDNVNNNSSNNNNSNIRSNSKQKKSLTVRKH